MRNYFRMNASLFLILFLVGCFGTNSEIVNMGSETDDPKKPITDVYIEYPGPHERWAGPQNFSIHVNTTGSENAKVLISTAIFKADQVTKTELKPVSSSLNLDIAKEQVSRLNQALKEPELSPTQGCLSLIQVKLIRSDGSMISRQGCRGLVGWPRAASEFANLIIESAKAMQKAENTTPKPEPTVKSHVLK